MTTLSLTGNRFRAVAKSVPQQHDDVEPRGLLATVIQQIRQQAFFTARRILGMFVTALTVIAVLLPTAASHASVSLDINVDTIFESVNTWIPTFLPIAAIGLGISIALAVIAFVGAAILSGFKSPRR